MKNIKQKIVVLMIAVLGMVMLGQKSWAQQNAIPTVNPSITMSQQMQQNISQGQQLYSRVRDGQTSCDSLTIRQLQNIGLYAMQQAIGNQQRHAQTDQLMQNMLGSQGNAALHLEIGRRASGCTF